MSAWLQRRLARVLAALLGASLAAAWAVGEVLDQGASARHDQQKVAHMTEKMKTVCVGRFLIDLPAAARVSLTSPRIAGFTINALRETPDQFQQRLAAHEGHLQARPDRLGGKHNLEQVKELPGERGMAGKLFVHGRTVNEGTEARGFEVVRYRYEGVAVEAMVHGQGVSIDLGSDFYFPDRVDDLFQLARSLVPNPAQDIPAEPGFCVDGAYLAAAPAAGRHEQITLLAQLPEHPDVRFLLIIAAGLPADKQGLLERDAAGSTLFAPEQWLRFSRLRAAPRTIGGIAGEELVKRVHEENDALVYSFWWEVAGTADQALVPHLVLQMDTGEGEHGPVPSSLSEGAAMGLWDRISSSIRVRPVAPAPRAAAHAGRAAGTAIALGTCCWAGERCPASGWWHCSAGGKGVRVLGGQRQYQVAGRTMRQALLLPPQSWWEKLRGLQPSVEAASRTLWTLVERRQVTRPAAAAHSPAPPAAAAAAPLPVPAPATPAAAASPGARLTAADADDATVLALPQAADLAQDR